MGWEPWASVVAIILAVVYAYGVSRKAEGRSRAREKAIEEGADARERESEAVAGARGNSLRRALERLRDRKHRST